MSSNGEMKISLKLIICALVSTCHLSEAAATAHILVF